MLFEAEKDSHQVIITYFNSKSHPLTGFSRNQQ